MSGSGIIWAICKSAPSPQTDNHTSIPPLSFFTGRLPFLPPNEQHQSTERQKHYITHTKISLKQWQQKSCLLVTVCPSSMTSSKFGSFRFCLPYTLSVTIPVESGNRVWTVSGYTLTGEASTDMDAEFHMDGKPVFWCERPPTGWRNLWSSQRVAGTAWSGPARPRMDGCSG